MEALKLHWLGHPLVELRGRAVKLETRKAVAMLSYLSLGSGQCQRELLATMFWPESSQQKAQANFRRTLSSLNTCLPGWIQADRESVTLKRNGKFWMDIDAFHQFLSRLQQHDHTEKEICDSCLAILEKTVELYHGEFLAGLNLEDAPDFDDWQFFHRDSIRQELAAALQRLSTGRAQRGEWEPAIASARRWVTLDRLHEPAHRMLIGLYFRAGQKMAAIRQYEELSRLLSEQLNQEPEHETRLLYEQVRGREDAGQVKVFSESSFGFPLLKTKLYIPSVPRSNVARSDLIDRLCEVEQKVFTIISAPAGFGKTTLLAEWIAQTSLPVAWLSLDSGDNDTHRFMAYLIAALDSIQEGVGSEAQQLMQIPQPISSHIILASLMNDLGKTSEPYVLVLDDYHFITEHAVHETVSYLLDHIPANMHIVISTRADPPLQIGRLRANDQVLELRTKDLRFSSEAAAAFLNDVMKLELSTEDINTLETRTEGWIVGLKMAALSLQGREDASEFIRAFSGSHRYVLDYLMEEVLKQQPDYIQTFLLETSFLEKLNGSLYDSLIGNRSRQPGESGQVILEYLERSNLFVIPLDEKKQWYRYHHLFADLLESRFESRNAAKVLTLRVQASKWFEQHEMMDESIRYATAAKDYQRVLHLVGQNAPKVIKTGKLNRILGWLEPLPKDLILNHPWIATIFAWALISKGEMEKAEPYLLKAYDDIQSHTQEAGTSEILGTIATLRALIAEHQGETELTIEMASLAFSQLNHQDEVALSSVKFALARAYYMNGDFLKAKELSEEALQSSYRIGTNNAIAPMASLLGQILILEGRLNEAEIVFRKSMTVMEERGVENCFVAGTVWIYMGDLKHRQNLLEDARQLIERGIELNQRWGVISAKIIGLSTLAGLLITNRELKKAEQLILEADELREKINALSDIGSALRACHIRLYLAKGDCQTAFHLLLEDQISFPDSLTFRTELDHILFARILISQRNYDEALRLLKCLGPAAKVGGRYSRLAEILVLQALVLQAQGKIQQSQTLLVESLLITEPDKYVRVFLDEGEPMFDLLKQLKVSKPAHRLVHFVNRLLEAFTPA